MKITYVKWRDASYCQGDATFDSIGLVELEEIGFKIKETSEYVTLSIERPIGSHDFRLVLSIPKVNIVELFEIDISKTLRSKRLALVAKVKNEDKQNS